MSHALTLHPESRSRAVTRIDVDVARPRPGTLVLRYFVTGAIGDLSLPPVTAPARRDELWQATCFEAFVRAPGSPVYHEFNFAPSTEWAAYAFSGYRDGMEPLNGIAAPYIETRSTNDSYELIASFDLPDDAPRRIGLSAVIEETAGSKSWWSLRHPPGKPDFHHFDSFAIELS